MGKLHSRAAVLEFFVWHAKDSAPCQSEQKVKILRHFQQHWQAWDIWGGSAKMHVAWQAQYKRHFHQSTRRSGRWFPLISWERLQFEHQTCRFANVILRDRCSTSYDLASISWQAQYFRQMEWKNRKTHWYDSTFQTSERLAKLLFF